MLAHINEGPFERDDEWTLPDAGAYVRLEIEPSGKQGQVHYRGYATSTEPPERRLGEPQYSQWIDLNDARMRALDCAQTIGVSVIPFRINK